MSSQRTLSLGLSYQLPIRVPLLPIRATCLAHIMLLDLMVLNLSYCTNSTGLHNVTAVFMVTQEETPHSQNFHQFC
jgi:hypothetical protein